MSCYKNRTKWKFSVSYRDDVDNCIIHSASQTIRRLGSAAPAPAPPMSVPSAIRQAMSASGVHSTPAGHHLPMATMAGSVTPGSVPMRSISGGVNSSVPPGQWRRARPGVPMPRIGALLPGGVNLPPEILNAVTRSGIEAPRSWRAASSMMPPSGFTGATQQGTVAGLGSVARMQLPTTPHTTAAMRAAAANLGIGTLQSGAMTSAAGILPARNGPSGALRIMTHAGMHDVSYMRSSRTIICRISLRFHACLLCLD